MIQCIIKANTLHRQIYTDTHKDKIKRYISGSDVINDLFSGGAHLASSPDCVHYAEIAKTGNYLKLHSKG